MCTSIISVSCFAGLFQERRCILGGNSLSMTFPNRSGCWFVLMNCPWAYCFPMAVQLDCFTGAPKMKMMLVWGFSLIAKALLQQIVRKLFMQEAHPHPVDTSFFHFPSARALVGILCFCLPHREVQKEVVFLT